MAQLWAIDGDDVLYSNMDGGGTPFADGDWFTVTNGSITADQNGAAGAACSISNLGSFAVNPDVSALFNNGGSHILTINEGGILYGNGTSGHNAVIGGTAGTDMNQISCQAGGTINANYTTFEYFSNANSINDAYGSNWFFFNCPFHHMGGSMTRLYSGFAYFENCSNDDVDTARPITCIYSGTIVMKNCDWYVSPVGFWLQGTRAVTVFLLGTNRLNIAGGGWNPCDETNDSGIYVENIAFYDKLTLSEGNNLTSCDVTVTHPSLAGDGYFVDDRREYIPSYFVTPQTDGSGDVDIYLLREVYYHGVSKYWSDSGQAEAGDNQKFTIGLIKDGYLYGTTTAWADGGTASITLDEAGAGRQPRERRHGV